jgi:hypothetical protein
MRPWLKVAYFIAIAVFTAVVGMALFYGEEPFRFDPLLLAPAIVACTDYYGTILVAMLVRRQFPNADLRRLELNPMWKSDVAGLRLFSFSFALTVLMRLVVFLMLSQAPDGPWIEFYRGAVGFMVGVSGAPTVHHLMNALRLLRIVPTHRHNDSLSLRVWRIVGEDTSVIADGVCLALLAIAAFVVPSAIVIGGLIGVASCRLIRILLAREAALGVHG